MYSAVSDRPRGRPVLGMSTLADRGIGPDALSEKNHFPAEG